MRRSIGKAAAALALAGAIQASAQTPPPAANPDLPKMRAALAKAKQIAGLDLYPYYTHRCLIDQRYRWTISRSIQANGAIDPVKVTDNLYFVGQNAVTAWAVRTSAGIVIFDTLNSPEEAKTYIADGLTKLGLNPANIKYVVITHSHGDHYMGAQWLKDTYGAKLIASNADWAVMDKARAAPPSPTGPRWTPPKHDTTDIGVEDGQKMTIGDTTFTFYVTPGHTPGTLSTIFKTTDNGAPHVVGYYGGLGTPGSAADKKLHIAQLERFKPIARAAGVDMLIANHQTQDQALPKLEELRIRAPGDPNPYVLGPERFQRYLALQQACTEFAMAQQGQN